MEQMDLGKAQRVWQRVQAVPPQMPELTPLIGQLWEAADLCRRLEASNPKMQPLTKQLSRQADCVHGIHLLRTGLRLPKQPLPASRENKEAAHRRLIGLCLRLARQYRKNTDDPEYGPVFANLEQQIVLLLRTLLETL